MLAVLALTCAPLAAFAQPAELAGYQGRYYLADTTGAYASVADVELIGKNDLLISFQGVPDPRRDLLTATQRTRECAVDPNYPQDTSPSVTLQLLAGRNILLEDPVAHVNPLS